MAKCTCAHRLDLRTEPAKGHSTWMAGARLQQSSAAVVFGTRKPDQDVSTAPSDAIAGKEALES